MTDTIKKLYIAGPMTGLPAYNYPAFEQLEQALVLTQWIKPENVLNPIRIADGDTTKPYGFYISESIKMLAQATDVVFLNGWKKSRGAVLEYHIAKTMGLKLWDQYIQPLSINLTISI